MGYGYGTPASSSPVTNPNCVLTNIKKQEQCRRKLSQLSLESTTGFHIVGMIANTHINYDSEPDDISISISGGIESCVAD